MEAVSQEAAVLGSSVAEVAIVVGAEAALVEVVVAEGKRTSAGTMAAVRPADGSAGNWGCSHKPMGRRQRLGGLAVVVCVDLPGNRYRMTSRSVVGSQCCYGHRQVEQSCSLQPQQQPQKIECAGPRKVLILQWAM
jgi:hypothetical protein